MHVVLFKNNSMADLFFLTIIKHLITNNLDGFEEGLKAGRRFVDPFALHNKIYTKIESDNVIFYLNLFIVQNISDINVTVEYLENENIAILVTFDEHLDIFKHKTSIQFISGIIYYVFNQLLKNKIEIRSNGNSIIIKFQ